MHCTSARDDAVPECDTLIDVSDLRTHSKIRVRGDVLVWSPCTTQRGNWKGRGLGERKEDGLGSAVHSTHLGFLSQHGIMINVDSSRGLHS